MRILIANFRHLYQRHGLWIVYGVWVLVVSVWVLSSLATGGLFGGFLLGSFLVGLLVGTVQMETSSKPFTFGLPGHRDAVRRLVFLVGPLASLAFLLVFVVLLGRFACRFMMTEGFIPLVAYLCVSMAAYLLGADVALSSMHQSGAAIATAILVLAMCALFDVPSTIQYSLLHWPVAAIALALAVGLASWWWLGRRAWLRRSCARPWIGFFDPWDRRQAGRFRELYATRFIKNIPSAWDRFFQRVIGSRPSSGLGKYAWGALYTTCVLVGPQWKGIVTIALAWLAFAGYFPAAAPMIMGFLPLMTVGFLQSPLGTPLLVVGGRRERFLATAVLILGFSILWVLLFGLLVGLTHLLAPLVPAVTVQGVTLSLHAITFKVVLIPLVLVPVVGLVQTLFCRKPVRLVLSIVLVTTIMMISSTPLGLHQAVTPSLAVVGTILSWGICLSLLYRIAMHSDLATR